MTEQVVHGNAAPEPGTELVWALEQAGRRLPSQPERRSFVTIGVFDGVHRGHQQLVTRLVAAAEGVGAAAVGITFDPHPLATLGQEPPRLLMPVEARVDALMRLGLDVLVVLPFTPAVAHTSATEFVDLLSTHLGLTEVWGGPDLAIGHRREGDAAFLRRVGAERGFAVRIVGPLAWNGDWISSSRVRAALVEGNMGEANGCLGRPYRLAGTVVRGRGLGREIGIPTANLDLAPELLVPAGGIYACRATTEHLGSHPAVINVGTRPTVDGGGDLVVEAHLLDFEADLYGQTLALDFHTRLRSEQTFPSLDALVDQVRRDILQAREILADEPLSINLSIN